MHAFVYKSLRQADTYVYLASRDDFARLPPPLRTQLGELRFVLVMDPALTWISTPCPTSCASRCGWFWNASLRSG